MLYLFLLQAKKIKNDSIINKIIIEGIYKGNNEIHVLPA